MDIGKWTETTVVRPQERLEGPDGQTVEPATVWERRTEDGQLQRAVVYGSGRKGEPWTVQLRTQRLEGEELVPGQELGPARWPTMSELQTVVSLLPEGTMCNLPPLVSQPGHDPPQAQSYTLVQLIQVGAIEGSRSHRDWTGGIVTPTFTPNPGRA